MGVAGRDWRGDWEKGVWLLLPRGEGVWPQLTLMNTLHDSLTHKKSMMSVQDFSHPYIP